MTPRGIRLIPRIGLFASLIYILSWATTPLPNVNLIFFIVFSAGYMWGTSAGIITGAIGMGITTFFNPFGPAALPVMIAQVAGTAVSGLIGSFVYQLQIFNRSMISFYGIIILSAILCTVCFFLPVNLIDSWIFQPFWERFYISSVWSLVSVGSNILIFTLLFPALRTFYAKEREALC